MSDPQTIALSLAASAGLDGAALVARPGVVPVASPMYQGVDATAYRLSDGSRQVWARIPHPDAFFADPASGIAAAHAAGVAGLGPQVLADAPGTGALIMEDLSDSHRTGTLDRLLDPQIREAVLRARTRFQAGPPLPRSRSVFSHIASLAAQAEDAAVALPPDWPWMQGWMRAAGEAIAAAGIDLVPAHGDGNASNLLIGAGGDIRLVDFDMAAMMDPFEDLGSFLVEAHAFDPDAQESMEMACGRMDERLFNRARIYGVADDLRWGLIGAILARTSGRTELEFLKYAAWRFLRARFALRDPRFEERVRRL
ncbi:MAG: phosphotransferase [Pseudomonadota bacterium]